MADYFLQAYQMATRTARKPHVCCECGGNIYPGEKYHYHSGIGDDGPEDYKVCIVCDEIRDSMNDRSVWDSPGFGELYECVSEAGSNEQRERFRNNAEARGVRLPDWF